MNFYPHHIGDFNNATRHLTRVERSVYRDAIELYYDTESALTSDVSKLEKRLICRSEDEKSALKSVLEEFFELTDDGYFHVRCDSEIAKYRSNTSAKSKAGKASAEARSKKAEERKKRRREKNVQNLTGVEQVLNSVTAGAQQNPTNQEPLTNNHKPVNKKIIKKRKLPDDFLLTDILRDRAEKYWAGKTRSDLNPDDEFEKFRASHVSRGTSMLDWDAAWQTWYSNAPKYNKPPFGGSNEYQQTNQSRSAVGRVNEAIAARSREREQIISSQRAADDGSGILVQGDDGVFRS